MFSQACVSHSVHNRPRGYSLRRGRYASYWNAFFFLQFSSIYPMLNIKVMFALGFKIKVGSFLHMMILRFAFRAIHTCPTSLVAAQFPFHIFQHGRVVTSQPFFTIMRPATKTDLKIFIKQL